MAVAAFADVHATKQAAVAPNTPSSEIQEGADLNRELGSRRSARSAARLPDLLPNPYGSAANGNSDPSASGRNRFDERMAETNEENWSNPYAVARIPDNDERWSNPYGAVKNTRSDERWFNPYVAVQNTGSDDRWSNPYAASVRR